MKRPSRVKTVKPTFFKIQEFIKEKTLMFISPENEWLINNSIKISKTNKQFTFEIENKSFKRIDETVEDLDKAFLGNQMKGENKYFTCFPYASDNIKMPITTEKINGTLDSLIEGKESDFDNKFLRFIQPVSKTAKIGNLSDALDLNTDQEVTYGVGIVKLRISNNYFDVFRISDEKKEFIFIDSSQAMSIEDFNTSTTAFFQAYSYIFGFFCGGESYIVYSNTESFEVIENVLFKYNTEEKIHNNYIFDSHEIRELKFSNTFFLFPSEVFSNMWHKLINEEKYKRTLNIIHEANLNDYSLSTCILFSSALETISSIVVKENNGLPPIDEDRFMKSKIADKLKKKVENNGILEKADKEFLIEKRLPNFNKPTNVDKFELPFNIFQISLPDNFKKALKYRDKYLHGSVPRGNKLGTFQADNFNRAFELQFLVNVLTLKYVGYKGFLRNRSAEIEFNIQKGQGKEDEDILISQSLYYEI